MSTDVLSTASESRGATPSARSLYRSLNARRVALLVAFCVALCVVFVINVATGPAMLGLRDVVRALISPATADPQTVVIVREMRIPIALMALAVGGGLALAGAEMQTILGNPLASPFTLGISAAAAFGASLAIVLGVSVLPHADPLVMIPANAFVFALGSAAVIFAIARARQGAPHTIVLAGIALVFLFDSAMTLLKYVARDDQLQAMTFWSFGSLENATLAQCAIVGVSGAVALCVMLSQAWKLTALTMGDAKARSLGIDTGRLRLGVLITVSFVTAVAVSFVGTIGFIGLVSPHIARGLVGEDQRYFLPASCLTGALMLSVAAVISKLALPGADLPIGIATSLIGVPFLLWLVLSKKHREA